MSRREWVNGVSAPRVLSRQEQIDLLPRLADGIRRGVPTPRNPLGLYELISLESTENGYLGAPLSYEDPYTVPDDNFIDRNAYLIDVESAHPLGPDTSIAAAGLVFAGIYRYAFTAGMSELEQRYVLRNDMLRFGAMVTANPQRDIAKIAMSSGLANSVEELRSIADASYEHTAEYLTRFSNDEAVQIEASLGVASRLVASATSPVMARYDVLEQGVIGIAHDGICPKDHSRCGGTYMTLADGTTFHRLLWDRILDVHCTLPWLYPSLVNEALVTKSS